jgi:hypothetical protein
MIKSAIHPNAKINKDGEELAKKIKELGSKESANKFIVEVRVSPKPHQPQAGGCSCGCSR